MSTVGESLKNARKEAGLTIEDLQKLTKIQKKYLVAMEADDFDSLPGTYYVRAFIKQYAETVGMDSDLLLEAYDQGYVKEDPSLQHIEGSRTEKFKTERKTLEKKSSVQMIVVSVIAVLIVVGVIYSTWKDNVNRRMIQTSGEPKVEMSKTEKSSESSSTKESSSSQEDELMTIAYDEEEGNLIYMNVENAKNPVKVEFGVVSSPCWIGVQVDNNYVYQKTLQPREEAAFVLPDDAAYVEITLGAAANATVKLNGEKVNFDPEKKKEVVKKQLMLTISYKGQEKNSRDNWPVYVAPIQETVSSTPEPAAEVSSESSTPPGTTPATVSPLFPEGSSSSSAPPEAPASSSN